MEKKLFVDSVLVATGVDKMGKDFDILALFHHIHHINEKHIVHHCGGEHAKINFKLGYKVKHCSCNKHSINKKEVIGHDLEWKEILVEFTEQCPESGWHIESGIAIGEEND